ncbi:MAG: S8 family serine peptidase, partial [Thermodesulfobacteriota bacterium]|nr:S8 family serine peptidase [Thermodesulfobacteriota bacterium]
MKSMGTTGKSSSLFLILFISLFCFANVSFSGEGERIKYAGERITSEANPGELAQDKAKKGKPILLRLGRTHFDPLTRPPEQKAGIEQIQTYEREQTGYYIVQFDGPVENSWKETLNDTGVVMFDYIPDFAFIIRMDSTEEDTVRALPHVRWLGIYQPSYRISQRALDKVLTRGKETSEYDLPDVLLRVTVFPGEDLDRIKADIAAQDGMILDEVTTEWKTTLKVKIAPDRIANLPAIPGVKWVEPWPEWKLHNDKSTDIMNVRTPRNTHGLYGAGQTVGVCDTGLDQGSASPVHLHDDFENGSGGSRVTQIFDLVGDGADDVNSGHGTHVSGSVLGNGLESGSDPSSNSFPSDCFAGMAPKANLIFQAVEENLTESLSGLPSDLNILFGQADVAGADLHTNSWGDRWGFGGYSSQSEDVDEYMWNHKDFLVLFSAGNSGRDLDGDGVVDLYNGGAPGTAKNCLTVGASEGNRPSFSDTWGGWWSLDFTVDPIFSDRLADDP